MPFVDFFEIHIYAYDKNHGSLSSIRHFDKPCIGFILEGECEILHNGKIHFAQKGDLLYIAKGTNYCSYWKGYPEIRFYSIPFSYTDPYEMSDFKFQISRNFPREKFDNIYKLSENDFFLRLEAFYSLLSEMYPKLVKSKKQRIFESVRPATEYIEKNCTEKIYVQELASMCNLSPSRFFTVFKKATGNTPVGYKNAMRIQKGMELLYETDMTVEQISDTLNFSSPAHFRNQFRKILGITPKEIRG